MKRILSFVCLVSVITSSHGLQSRILGGTDAPEGSFKYHVFISASRGNRDFCGGSIIHKRWVMTAAHCMNGQNIRKLLIQVGSVTRGGRGGTFYRVEKIVLHEAFHRETFVNDIALLRVDRDIEFNDRVQPVVLPAKNMKINNNDDVVFTGFGIQEDSNKSQTLKYVFLKVFDHHRCRQVEPRITETQLCTLQRTCEGPAPGDSGGPLVNNYGVQVGIDSGAYAFHYETCATVPDVYTRVSCFRDWIDEKISQH